MTRILTALILTLAFALPGAAQSVRPPDDAVNVDPIEASPAPLPAVEDGAADSPLADILRRQEALRDGGAIDGARAIADDAPVALPGSDEAGTGALGAQGGASDSDLWRLLRADAKQVAGDVSVSTGGAVEKVLVQDGGMRWMLLRDGPLRTYGGGLLAGVIALLAVFFLLRGRIRIEGGKSGATVTRFKSFERASHWLLSGSFILLAVTGLAALFGRVVLVPLLGHEANAGILAVSKWVHNNVSWAFMVALGVVFVLWVWQNIPNRADLRWAAQGGGFVGDKHPPAGKFNLGQKMIFWSVIILGASVSASGLSLLFPFELPMFGATFDKVNALGILGWVGLPDLPAALAPQEEMQFAQIWHGIVSFVFMAIILAHIYIGTLGMEGAYDAMGSGEVDVRWAEQHHSLWLEEVRAEERARNAPSVTVAGTPAE